MSKFLFIFGEGDYGAMDFLRKYNPEEVYKEMVEENATVREFEEEDDLITVMIKTFDKVDSRFITFIKNELVDYDLLKARDIIKIED